MLKINRRWSNHSRIGLSALALWILSTGAIVTGDTVPDKDPAAGEGRAVVEGVTVSVVNRNLAMYCGWPTVALTGSGDLVAVYSGGREEHVCPFGRLELIRSTDKGKTWSAPRVLVDSPLDDRDAGVLAMGQGRCW